MADCGASASCSKKSPNIMDEEPDYDHLDLSFNDNDESDSSSFMNGTESSESQFTQYILGTLLVRMVAARSVQTVGNSGGLGQLLGGRSRTRRGFLDGRGSSNPFAKIQFLGQTQRTSQIYDDVNPVWPRGEEYYFDVSLPVPKLAMHDENDEENRDNNNDRAGKIKQHNQPLSSMVALHPSPNPILTISLLHSEGSNSSDFNTKKLGKTLDGTHIKHKTESKETFLGAASIDLRQVITGKIPCFDRWIPLSGGENVTGDVRIICEYQPTDPPPRPGDQCKLTGFCLPADLFPIPPTHSFMADEVIGNNDVILSYVSPEGWLCTFRVHRFMVICAERHEAALEKYQDQIMEIAEKLACSPLVDTVTDVVHRRVPQDGLVDVGAAATLKGAELVGRWLQGGLGTVVGDIMYATNWDGDHSPNNGEFEDGSDDEEEEEVAQAASKSEEEGIFSDEDLDQEALPGMPSCPITGQPMRIPVVAADGHTYEKSAIYRWMRESDISPLTGAKLPHKELVPNYLLLSSLSNKPEADSSSDQSEKLSVSTDSNLDVATSDAPDSLASSSSLTQGSDHNHEVLGQNEETKSEECDFTSEEIDDMDFSEMLSRGGFDLEGDGDDEHSHTSDHLNTHSVEPHITL